MNKQTAIEKINDLSKNGTPFLWITDFRNEQNEVLPIDQIRAEDILFDINGRQNFVSVEGKMSKIVLKTKPIAFQEYKPTFDQVHQQIAFGNTYLLNLTFPTPIESSHALKDIFFQSKAKYKLWYKDEFVVFSPESFVTIQDGKISSFPMKGTIDAKVKDAKNKILQSEKEMAEHTTIVDLIRNDMSIFAREVTVEQFRYVEKVRTNRKDLLQVSSKISGKLAEDYRRHLGEIVYSLLPAGSICGVPKAKTLEIIEEVENYDRGFYTGIVGYFDGQDFDSGVMIRFIQKSDGQLIYKSGGGIHCMSDCRSEYQEMMDKVYVPVY